jgi:sugar transferase (PEP-CTERM system associated)
MPYILKKYYPWRNLLFILGEGLLIFLIINVVFILFKGLENHRDLLALNVFRAITVTFVFQMCFYYFDLYDIPIIPRFYDHMIEVLQAFGFGCILLAIIYFIFPVLTIPTVLFWTALLFAGMTIFSWRFFYFRVLERRLFTQSIALVGTGRMAGELVATIHDKKDSGFKIVAFVGEDNPRFIPRGIPVLADIKDLESLCLGRGIEKIIIAVDEKRGMPMHDLINYKFMGIQVLDVVGFYEDLTGKIMVEGINPSWLVFSEGFYVGVAKRVIKRIMDLSIALTMLLLTLPIFLISAIIIKLDSPGEVFYRQERVGKNGRLFTVIKFRSMYSDAEKDGPVWAQNEDDRVTRYGRFIRNTRIDELPQLINVIKGEMSIVGPRPERSVFVEDLAKSIPFYTIRHIVKPGITGWAQIFYPYGASVEDALRKLEYDLYYIKNLSIAMDLATIFQTVKVILSRRGSR